jgi:hypothetical protein
MIQNNRTCTAIGAQWTDNRSPKPQMPPPSPQPVNRDGTITVTATTVEALSVGYLYRLSHHPDGSLEFLTVPSKKSEAGQPVPTVHDYAIRVDSVMAERRETPTWVIIVGVLGLFLFLIGIFFFVRETVQYAVLTTAIGLPNDNLVSGGWVPDA